MDIDNILVELEIIGQIKENDKLAISVIPGDTKIFVSTYSWYSRFIRKYNGYNRDTCIKHIETLVDRIEKTSNTIINGSLVDMCITIKTSIKKSIIGLNNLKTTYNDDSEIVARLVILINRLEKTLTLLEDFNDTIDIDLTSSINLGIDNGLPNYNSIDNTIDNIIDNTINNTINNKIDKSNNKLKNIVNEPSSNKNNTIDNQEIDREPNSDNKQCDNQDNTNHDKEKPTLSNVVNNSKKQSNKSIDRQASSLMDSNLKNFTLNNGKK